MRFFKDSRILIHLKHTIPTFGYCTDEKIAVPLQRICNLLKNGVRLEVEGDRLKARDIWIEKST